MNAHQFNLEGALVFSTLKKYQTQFAILLKDRSPESMVVDLSQVDRCDSAGLALLIDMVAQFKKQAIDYKFQGLPANLLSLAKFYEVDRLLTHSSFGNVV